MVTRALVSIGLSTLLMGVASPAFAQAEMPAQPAPEATPSAPDATPAPAPTDQPTDAPSTQPADAPAVAPDAAAAPAATPAPAGMPPAATPPPPVSMQTAPLGTRLLMDAVTGVAGGAVVLVLGLGVATPLALLPWIMPSQIQSVTPLGVPLSLLITGGIVGVVLTAAVVASAVVQRVVRPLIGPQPSLLGAVLGSLFFGGVGAAIGLVASFLLVTGMPEPMRSYRNKVTGDISGTSPQALAITSAMVVGLAVPLAALGAAIGGPISAEVEDNRAVEGSVPAK